MGCLVAQRLFPSSSIASPHLHVSSTMGLDDFEARNDDPEEEEEDEEELVDPMDAIKEACHTSHHCSGYSEKYSTCNDRVTSRSKTEEVCSEELFDLLHCVDHCMGDSLFKKLK